MHEPWYQSQGPSLKEVILDMTNIFGKENNKLVTDTINQLYPQNDFGSYRGYYTFIRTPLIAAINTSVSSIMETLPEK
tara:strand:- start:608 stop:841 length:234 start_codon:yes stop_codon:yes gene_type:complete